MTASSSLPPITLVLGGARSGKSAYAERLAIQSGLRPIYLATGTGGDDEMADRIREQQQRRGDIWTTVEEPLNLVPTLSTQAAEGSVVLLDCLTLWLSNLMTLSRDVEDETKQLVAGLGELSGPVIVVTNEVGLGIVPANDLARQFRDHAGRLNQAVAAVSDRVVMMVSGLPMSLKPAI